MLRASLRALPKGARGFAQRAPEIESRYASALFETAKGQGALDQVYADMSAIRSYMKESQDFNLFVETPGISAGDKTAALKAVGKGFSPLSMNFLYLLVENKRLNMVDNMVDQFEEYFRKEKGIILCHVTTAGAVSEKQKKAIMAAAASQAAKGAQLNYEWNTQPAILGGFVVKLGEMVLDYSVTARLDRLTNNLLTPID